MNKKLFLLSCLILFVISISCVSAADVLSNSSEDTSFSALQDIIDTNDAIELTHDYKFDNSSDDGLKNGIFVNKSNVVINGNGFTVDGSAQARIFNITGNNVTLLNLRLINGFALKGGAVCGENVTFENVTFINNFAQDNGGAVTCLNVDLIACEFDKNGATDGAAVFFTGNATVKDTKFLNSHDYNSALIYAAEKGVLYVDNCLFANSTSKYAPAIYSNDKRNIVKNSIFVNLKANLSSGAVALRTPKNSEFENCTFENTTAINNGGALFIDVYGEHSSYATDEVIIKDSRFIDSWGNFGGAIVQLGGNLTVLNSNFTENNALYDGGAIYVS